MTWLKGVAKRAREGLQELNDRVAPVARVIAEAGPVLLELRGATTPIGIITTAATALNASNAWLSESGERGPMGTVLFPWSESLTPTLSDVIAEMALDEWDTEHGFRRWALRDDFAGLVCQSIPNEPDVIRVYKHSRTNHRRLASGVVDDSDVNRLRVSIKTRLQGMFTGCILEMGLDTESPERTRIKTSEIKALESPRAREILDDTVPLIPSDGGRCILLTGEPGTGKTTMAAWIADAVCTNPIDRIIHLRPDLAEIDDVVTEMALKIFEPKVVILDDIDKLEDGLPNRVLEVIRRHARLVILTANNGLDERVIDGSLIRPGRIDETFVVEGIGVDLVPSGLLEKLSPEDWNQAKTWPASFRAELANRIRGRGVDRINLEEMATRVGMLVHSAGRTLEEDEC